MMIPPILARLVRALGPIPSSRAADLPLAILRELDAEGRHFLDTKSGRQRPAFSFRIHPMSELTEYRDRLFLATFPAFGDKVG